MNNDIHYPRSTTPVLRAIGLVSLILLVSVLMTGCASVGVQPWERDLMAKRDMQPVTHPLIDGVDDHIYFSKEASTGGKNSSGGGCGCN
jgi:cell division protein FtsL